MTISLFRWCDTSGHWHDGYPDSGCHYTHVERCDDDEPPLLA